MTIWEIDQAIAELLEGGVNEETGELTAANAAQLEALQMERDQKAENLALAVKNMKAGEDAIANEIDALTARKAALKKKRERAQDYLRIVLDGEKFQTPRVAVSWRRSEAVEPDEEFMNWAMDNDDSFLRYKPPEINKTAIKAAVKAGQEIPHVHIVQSLSPQIK